MNNLLIAIVAGLGSMVGWGTADFFAKKTIDVIGDLKTLFWAQLIGVIPLAAIFLASSTVPQLSHFDPFFLILLGVFSAVSYLPLYNGFGKGEVSLLSPVFASYSVVLVVLSAIFLHEMISGHQWIATLVVFAGILLISGDPGELRSHFKNIHHRVKGLPEVLSAMVMYSFWLFFLDKFLQNKDWVFPLLIIRVGAVVTLLVYAWFRKINLRISERSLWKFLACIGVFDVAAFGFVSYGFSNSSYTSIIAVLSATFSIPTIILAAVFLKEKIRVYQAIAIFLIICGIAIISLG
jgi:drug/metabolite transporter (DMT)-like permease